MVSGGALMEICNARVADWSAESVRRTLKLKVPAAVGVPLMVPFDARLRAPGRDPVATDHE
jgi:hypothetical protein